MSDDGYKPQDGDKKPWEPGFSEQEYSQKSAYRRYRGDDPNKITGSAGEPTKE